jgi:hypothetical protein
MVLSPPTKRISQSKHNYTLDFPGIYFAGITAGFSRIHFSKKSQTPGQLARSLFFSFFLSKPVSGYVFYCKAVTKIKGCALKIVGNVVEQEHRDLYYA